jgi:hypothetical protein
MAPSARFRAPTRGERTAGGTEIQVVYNSPSFTSPLDSAPPRAWNGAWVTNYRYMPGEYDLRSLLQLNLVGARSSRAAPGRSGPLLPLILFFTCLFSGALTSQRSFHTLFFAGLQVEGVSLDLLNDVFLLNLAFEPA